MEFSHKEIGVPMTLADDIVATTINNRIDATYGAMIESMNKSLYRDMVATMPVPSLRRRVSARVQAYYRRITDAWLVLTGQADIGDGW